MSIENIKPQKGDIVQLDPKKYPDLAWFYYEVKTTQIIDRGSYKFIEVELKLPKMKTGGKKSRKKAKKINKIIKNKTFNEDDIIIALQHPSNTLIHQG